MKKPKQSWICGLVLGGFVLIMAHGVLQAAQCVNPLPVAHLTGGYFANCPDTSSVNGFMFTLATPSSNSNGANFTCNAGNAAGTIHNGAGNVCQVAANNVGDGKV